MPRQPPSPDDHFRRAFPTRSDRFRKALQVAARVAPTNATVLIEGESGTGKDRLARTIHQASGRSGQSLVVVSPASISSELFESELFGFEKGAFTDAAERKPGRVEAAHKGTLYLDEVGVTPLAIQPKLLRFVESSEFSRIGGWTELRVDTRIIASSSIDLHSSVEKGTFRKDLLYRLNVVTIRLAPLRERSEDIALLAGQLLELHRTEGSAEGISAEGLDLLSRYRWPGNVRELENVVRGALMTSSSPILGPGDFDLTLDASTVLTEASEGSWSLERIEESHIREILRQTGNNYSAAARVLGINRKTLLEKRRKYGIGDEADD